MKRIIDNYKPKLYRPETMTIKKLASEFGYEKPIHLTKELQERGVLKYEHKAYTLTKEAINRNLGKIHFKALSIGRVPFNVYSVGAVERFIRSNQYLPIEEVKSQNVDIKEFLLDEPIEIDADLAYTLMEMEEEYDPSDEEQQEPTFTEGSRGSIHSGGKLYHSTTRSFRSNGY